MEKISIILGSFALILIILIVIIIISFTSQSEENNKKDDDQTPDDKYYVGQILCTYDVHSAQVKHKYYQMNLLKKQILIFILMIKDKIFQKK